MKILIVDVYYPVFLQNFYSKNTKTRSLKYLKHKNQLMDSMFGTADFYSKNLNKIGHSAEDVILNDIDLQEQWMKEYSDNNSTLGRNFLTDIVIRKISFLSGRVPLRRELEILKKQIDYYKPDIVYSHNLGYIDPTFLRSARSKIKLLVGQIACPPPPNLFLKSYDLIITSFPHFVGRFKRLGIPTEYLPLSFEPNILRKIPKQKRIYDLTFVGGISRAHKKGLETLYKLADNVKIDVWGYGKDDLNPKSNLYKYHHGEAWGRDMYKILLQSKITFNRHIDVAQNYANNTRLFEATGCGACLVTDNKRNLNDLFDVGKEVVAYNSPDDLIRKVKYLLAHPTERELIARRGQKKTISAHNYLIRMKQLTQILQKYI